MTPEAILGRFPASFQATLLPACEDHTPGSERHQKVLAVIDRRLRRMCGWVFHHEVPSEATLSRACAEFAACGLPAVVQERIVRRAYDGRLVGHVCRDATAMEGRERSAPPGEKTGSLFKSQGQQTAEEMLADLPQHCDAGRKKGSKGHSTAGLQVAH